MRIRFSAPEHHQLVVGNQTYHGGQDVEVDETTADMLKSVYGHAFHEPVDPEQAANVPGSGAGSPVNFPEQDAATGPGPAAPDSPQARRAGGAGSGAAAPSNPGAPTEPGA